MKIIRSAQNSPHRRPRPFYYGAFEELEDRTLLTTFAGIDLGAALPLQGPSTTTAGMIAPGAPAVFRIDPSTDSLLIARVHAQGTLTRLSLLDVAGQLLVQSDGQSTSNPDDLIDQHVAPGTDYLVLQSLEAEGSYTLAIDLVASSQPDQPALIGPTPPNSPRPLLGGFVDNVDPPIFGDFTGNGIENHAPVAFGDFSGDGRLDFAATDGIHLGNGDGTFGTPTVPIPLSDPIGSGQPPPPQSGGPWPFFPNAPIPPTVTSHGTDIVDAMIAGDFTGDGPLDLAAAVYDIPSRTGYIEILLNDGHGNFRAGASIELGAFFPTFLVAGHFHAGGPLDLAVAGYSSDLNAFRQLSPDSNRLVVLPGDGDGTFGTSTTIDLGNFLPTSLVAGDVQGDGRDDLAVAGVGYDSINLVGNPTTNSEYGTPVYASGRLEVLPSNGDGTFRPAVNVDLGTSSSLDLYYPILLATGDFKGDGHLDLAAVATGVSGDAFGATLIDVLQFNGDGTLGTVTTTSSPTVPIEANMITAGDFNGDSHPDLALGIFEGDNFTVVLMLAGNGDGTFRWPTSGTIAHIDSSTIVAGDFTGDGRTDLAVAGALLNINTFAEELPDTQRVEVLPGNGDGTFVGDIFSTQLFGSGSLHVELPSSDSSDVFTFPGPIVEGDFNGDGRLDIALIKNYEYLSERRIDSRLEVLLGNGDGTFGTPIVTDLGDLFPTSLVAGDFHGNGRLDLAVIGSEPAPGGDGQSLPGSNRVEVLPGNGDGTFGPPTDIDLGRYFPFIYSNLVTGDFQGDGRLDLAVLLRAPDNYDSSTEFYASNFLAVLPDNGDGTFGAPMLINLGDFSPTQLAAGDFRGNGRDDLALAGVDVAIQPVPGSRSKNLEVHPVPGTYGIEVFPSEGDGTFGAPTVINEGDYLPYALAVGDFTGDGRDNLVFSGVPSDPFSKLPARVEVLQGHPDGTVRVVSEVAPSNFLPARLVAGNFTGDGHLDLAISDFRRIEVLPGNGDGTFGTPLFSAPALQSVEQVFGDFNGDGLLDVATNTSDDGVQVVLGLGGGQFVDAGQVASAFHNTPLLADVNGDGTDDVFTIAQAGDILWRKGRSQEPGTFDPPTTINLDPTTGQVIPARDIAFVRTRQGPMIAAVDAAGAAVTLYAYRDGQFVRAGSLATSPLPVQIVAADLAGDGTDDLVVRTLSGTASVYLGDGQGGFTRRPDVPIGLAASDLALARLGGSGGVALVITNRDTGTLLVRPYLGDGAFEDPSQYPAGGGAYGQILSADGTTDLTSPQATAGVTAGTFTTGGTVGLATIDPGTNSFAILEGQRTGALANPIRALTSAPGQVIRTGDFTGDGVDDVAVLAPNGLTVYLGNGHGGFSRPTTYDVGPNSTGLTVADVNGDGIADLIVGNAFGDVLVLLGDGRGGFAPDHNVDQQIALAVADSGASGPPQFAFANQGLDQVAIQAGAQPLQTLGDHRQGVLAPGSVTLSDLTGDGIPDLIVANGGGNDILVYRGLGNGRYDSVPETFAVGTDPVSVTVADLTGNGIADLVVANHGSNDVSILLGQGQGKDWTLTEGPRLKAGFGPTATTVRDVYGTGIPDILVSDSQSNDVRLLKGLGHGFFDDANPVVYHTDIAPGPLFVGNFTGRPGQLDLVTLNAGSNDLSYFPDINGGNVVAQSLPSGGQVPIAAVVGDFGNGASDLLVANTGDGRLALFLGGSGGLGLAQTFEEPGLPQPTALAMDEAGAIFGVSEGVEAAIVVTLGLGVGGNGGGAGLGTSLLPTAPAEQQVAQLQPLGKSSLALVATLLSATVDSTSQAVAPANQASLQASNLVGPVGSGDQVAAGSESPAAPPPGQALITTVIALPIQALPRGDQEDGSGDQGAAGSPAPAAPAQALPAPLVELVAGLEESAARVRLVPRRGPLSGAATAPRASVPAPRAREVPLTRSAVEVNRALDPAITFDRPGTERARAIDSALLALGAETTRSVAASLTWPGPGARPAPTWRSAISLGSAALGLVAAALPLADLVLPTYPRLRRRSAVRSQDRLRWKK